MITPPPGTFPKFICFVPSPVPKGPALFMAFRELKLKMVHHEWRTCVVKQAQQKVMKAPPGVDLIHTFGLSEFSTAKFTLKLFIK